jgi:CRP-like cAMP-binding protein
MTREILIKNLAENTQMIEIIMTAAYSKISNLLERLQCATQQSIPISEQIARVLLMNRLAVKDEWVVFLTHEQIAQMLGRSRVAVTNNLGKLQELGSIRVSRKKILITHLDHLQDMVGESKSANLQAKG